MYAPPAIDTPNTARLGNASGKSTADESRPASPVITAARDPPLKIEKPDAGIIPVVRLTLF